MKNMKNLELNRIKNMFLVWMKRIRGIWKRVKINKKVSNINTLDRFIGIDKMVDN